MTYKSKAIGDIVSSDFRTAELFKEAKMDFCCGGKISLEESCKQKGIDVDSFVEDLKRIEASQDNSGHNYSSWTLDFLCDYIVNTHHKYVKKNLPDLDGYTKKIASVHGDIHPELIEVAELFGQLKYELDQHLLKEEKILFPAIKEVLSSGSDEAKKIIKSEIDRMGTEHEFAGGTMDKINQITNDYDLPDGACNTYRVCFELLSQFEDDLHIHFHLENNILYNKALEL